MKKNGFNDNKSVELLKYCFDMLYKYYRVILLQFPLTRLPFTGRVVNFLQIVSLGGVYKLNWVNYPRVGYWFLINWVSIWISKSKKWVLGTRLFSFSVSNCCVKKWFDTWDICIASFLLIYFYNFRIYFKQLLYLSFECVFPWEFFVKINFWKSHYLINLLSYLFLSLFHIRRCLFKHTKR